MTGSTTLAFSSSILTPHHHGGRSTPRMSQQQQPIIAPTTSSTTTTSMMPSLSTVHHHHHSHSHYATRRDVFEAVPLLLRTTTVAATVVSATTLTNPSPSIASYIDPTMDPLKITQKVYLDVSMESGTSTTTPTTPTTGRIVIGLYGDVMPKTVRNFVQLCESNAYAGTTFYRVVSNFTIQGGNIHDRSGKTGQSSFYDTTTNTNTIFEPDNYNIKHTKAGLVSMVRATPSGGADSRFFINVNDNGGWADDRYAAFGIVLDDDGSRNGSTSNGGAGGMDLVKKIEQVQVQPPKNAPKIDVKIVASGVLPL
jgi:peptidyl-prolyl cis-trans isomerase B (cyclophilin B)